MSGLDSKKVAKNSFMLIARMFVTMGISFYSSRIVLQALGVVDYGINNVVGGIISMLSFLNTSMITSVQRFLNYSLGEQDSVKTNQIFVTSLNVHLALAVIIILVAETIGLYFLNTGLNIPYERLLAANVIYQFSIVIAVVNVLSIPYKALIVAHERMGIYAYEAVFQSVAVLIISLVVLNAETDRLILYVFLLMLVNILIRIFDGWYCSREFGEKYKFYVNKSVLKELLSFSWWNTLSNSAFFIYTQGSVFLLNIFFGPAVNAAFALSNQVNLSLATFNSNFVMAVKPQIVKTYAMRQFEDMRSLLVYTLKISCVILGVISMPFMIRTDYILGLWLGNVPEYTGEFLNLALWLTIIYSFSDPITSAIQATGKIKKYNLSESFALLLILPLTYVLLLFGTEPYWVYYVRLVVFLVFLFVRFYFLHRLLGFSFGLFSIGVLLRIMVSVFIVYLMLLQINAFLLDGLIGFLLLCFISFVLNVMVSLFVAFDKSEQRNIISTLSMQLLRFRKK